MTDYHINIFYSEEDDAYIAIIPDLKYCPAHGETPEAALRAALVAKPKLPGWKLPTRMDAIFLNLVYSSHVGT